MGRGMRGELWAMSFTHCSLPPALGEEHGQPHPALADEQPVPPKITFSPVAPGACFTSAKNYLRKRMAKRHSPPAINIRIVLGSGTPINCENSTSTPSTGIV